MLVSFLEGQGSRHSQEPDAQDLPAFRFFTDQTEASLRHLLTNRGFSLIEQYRFSERDRIAGSHRDRYWVVAVASR